MAHCSTCTRQLRVNLPMPREGFTQAEFEQLLGRLHLSGRLADAAAASLGLSLPRICKPSMCDRAQT
jgi:hypothetical protein